MPSSPGSVLSGQSVRPGRSCHPDSTDPPTGPPTGQAGLDVVGADLTVPLVTGGQVRYANLDYAASAPCLAAVRDRMAEVLPWYASVHRGAGFASQVCTRLYEGARDSVRRFLGAPDDFACVFTRNTTDATNLLARALPPGSTVLVFSTEHHASLLPWPRVIRLGAPASPADALDRLDAALRGCPPGPRLVCVTGASNVTGELWPVTGIVRVARAHGARVMLDAAQLAPHRPVHLAALGVDYVAISGHKLYAPFGCGALAGRPDWLAAAEPYLRGGGATQSVSERSVVWRGLPERHEAGTPNVLGAVALAAACDALAGADRDALAAREDALTRRLRAGLAGIGGVRELALWPGHPRVGVVSFTVDGWEPARLAAALSAEHGIGVRDGAFCAHPMVARLTGGLPDGPGGPAAGSAVRASLGLASTEADVDRLVAATGELLRHGPRWRYTSRDGGIQPDPDPRQWPDFAE